MHLSEELKLVRITNADEDVVKLVIHTLLVEM